MQKLLRIYGINQGIGFRPYVYRVAKHLDLNGIVRNSYDHVEIILDGGEKKIGEFIKTIKHSNLPFLNIEKIEEKEGNFGIFEDFTIGKSRYNERKIITIPPDIAVCDECLNEMRDPKNRRYNYWFITCVHCGPRFTITRDLPYDRENTTMDEFKMCKSCEKEYTNPENRRYHSQTIACHECGPRLYLVDNDGNEVGCEDPIKEAAKLLKEGYILAIKGIGGIHVSSVADDDHAVLRLRKLRKNSDKPFAIMCKDIGMIETFAEVSEIERKMLESPERPIVLLKKSKNYYLSEYISPGLHTIGVMLPYTGLHYLLFDYIDSPIIMTSANLPGEPTLTDEKEALKKLSGIADYFLIHNREIYQRADDSVIRFIDDNPVFLRRSRGFVPLGLDIGANIDRIILSLGAELENTFSIYVNGKIYTSQYIGDTSNYETFLNLKNTIEKFKRLFGIKKFDLVIHDKHPSFNTTKLAKEISGNTLSVQHHFAHLFSCMAENKMKEAVGVIADGYGYGDDGYAWGGEILYIKGGELKRIGHLEYQPLIGLDSATKRPVKITVGILSKFMSESEIKKILNPYANGQEISLWLKQMNEKFNVTYTSSCGRFLDAVSSVLNVAQRRTYEGEPAMKLESVAVKGEKIFDIPIKIEKRDGVYILNTTKMFEYLIENIDKRREDMALSIHHALSIGLSEIAKKVDDTVCFSGGVAYNELFNRFMKENTKKLITQKRLPPGDGGISFGQIYASIFLDKLLQ